jgi:hypothetical protein
VDEKAQQLFGTPVPGPAYIGCFGAYGVARSAHGLIAAVVDVEGMLDFHAGVCYRGSRPRLHHSAKLGGSAAGRAVWEHTFRSWPNPDGSVGVHQQQLIEDHRTCPGRV